MVTIGSQPVRPVVVGPGRVEAALSGWNGDGGRGIEATVADPDTAPERVADERVDCLIIDSGACEGVVELVDACQEAVPVVVLVDDAGGTDAVDVLTAGATQTLPRRLVESDPDVLAGRVVSTAERERDRDDPWYQEVFDSVNDAIAVRDPETGDLVEVNESYADLLGYDPAEMVGMSIGDVGVTDAGYTDERGADIVDEVMAGEGPVTFEWQVETADGDRRLMDVTATAATIGGTEQYLAIARDVTERRRYERRLRTERDRRSMLFENNPDPILEVEFDGSRPRITDVNESFESVFGFDADSIGGRTVAEALVPESEREEYHRLLERTSRGETVETEVRRKTGDGVREFRLRIIPFEVGEQRQRAYVWYTDVTERNRRQRELEEERERYSTLVEQSTDGVVVVQDQEYVFVNDRFAEITGYDRETLLGRSFETVFTPEYRDLVRERYHQRVSGESPPSRYDVEVETADGEVVTLDLAVSRITHDGDPATLANFRDVTARRRRERAVRALGDATERMQDADTHEAVAQTAVEATREALDLPVAVCWWHDPETGRLEPAAATDAARDAGLVSALPPDRYEHEVFRSGRVTDSVPSAVSDETHLETGVLLPLGEHGLVAAGGREDVAYGEVVLDVARTLAEHTTTAVDRIERAAEVRESERRFRLIADRVDEIIFLSAPDFSEVFYVNDAYEDIWGEPVAELYENPRGFVDHIDPRDRAEFEADFEAMLADIERGDTADSYVFEFRVRPDDETVRWVRATGYPVTLGEAGDGGSGGVTRYVGIVEDVTERRELERTYRDVFESVSDGLVIHDPETGEILDVNDRFCEMNGYDRSALVGETVDVVTGPDHTFEHARERIRAAREEGPQLFEWRSQRADGETFPVEVHLSLVEFRGEERVLASVRDITERKRREREYEQIFDGVQDAIAVMDPETLEIYDANAAYLDTLGYEDLSEVQEQGVEGLSATTEGYTVEEGREVHRRVAETGEPELVEWRAETADGERRWLEIKVAPAVIGGEEVNVAIHRDITERKRREREYEQIFNGVNDIINVYDPETGDLVDVNDTMCELTGYDRETLLEEGLEAVSATDAGFTGDRAHETIEAVMTDDEPRTLEWQLEAADGERIWLDVVATPATVGGERRLLTISRDVTERRRTERRLRAILDRIDEAIFFAPAHELDEEQPAPDFVSSGYEAIWGQSLEGLHETYEAGFFGTLHREDEAGYRAFVDDLLRDIDAGEARDRYSREYRIERPDGEVRWVHSDYYPVEWADESPRLVVVSRDVTDRKARERRIASFDDATDDLATADSAAEATRTAVEAATEALGLRAVGAFLYDGDDGVLRPEVLTGPLPADDSDAVEPGDGPLWEAFATGTVVASDGGTGGSGPAGSAADAPGWLSALDEWRGLALGNHGLLLVGSPEGSLDSGTIQSAHVLAATLEAALNYLQGQRRLADREAELRAQTERAERLDRIARLTQRVESAITDASDPREVERAVCERLADSGSYALAWVGGVEVGADRLTARTIVGASSRYVEQLGLTTTDESADVHPAVRAWSTDEVRVADSIVGDGPAGDWRGHALAEGYQSLCAVPLTYDGVTHGVLTVAADAPNAFDDRERDVLDQLGTSVGYALAAIERRRALESDETVELEFTGSGVDVSVARAAREAGCAVRHERTVARQEGGVTLYVSFEGDVSGDVQSVAGRTLPGEVDVVTDEPGTTLVEARTDDWFGSPLAEYGAVLREASAEPGETTLTVEVPAGADVRSFVDRIGEMAPSLDLVAKRQHQRQERTTAELTSQVAEELTDRQLEVVRTALSAGYFEWPRENDGGEVADRLGITQPTLNKHLRFAERKTFDLLFDTDP